MHNPLVSVVMVVCNVERFLAEAIESILAQTCAISNSSSSISAQLIIPNRSF